MRIVRGHRPVVRRDNEVLGGIEAMGQLFERNPADPLRVTGPTGRWPRAVAARPLGNATGRVVSDVAVHVRVDEILGRHDEMTERAGEVVPVACLIQLKKRHDGRIIFVERRPSERKRLERRRLWIGLRLGIGHVERVRYERSVTGHPYVEVNRRGAFDGDRFGDDLNRLLCPTKLGQSA